MTSVISSFLSNRASRSIVRRLVAFCLIFSVHAVAHAQITMPSADAGVVIKQLANQLDDSTKAMAAMDQLVASKDARVLTVFQRVQDRTIYRWKDQAVFVPDFVRDSTGADVAKVYDLFSTLDEGVASIPPLADAVPKAELKEIPVARKVRQLIVNAATVLGLSIEDPTIRRAAARELGNKRLPQGLPKLREVAESDPVSVVRHDALESISIIIATGSDPTSTPGQKMEAVAKLGALKSIRSLDLLKEQSAASDLSAADKAIYAKSISQINGHLNFTNWIKNCFYGLSAGSIFVLLALGLAITFGLMGVVNMAHGEMLMIGAVSTWACYEFVGRWLEKAHPAYFDWYYVIAFPVSFLVAALVGLLIEVLIVRHLYKRPLDSLLATIGVSYILIQAVRLWKGDNLGMRKPTWAGGSWEIIQDVVLPYQRLFLIVLTIFCVVSVVVLFRYTRLGLMIRSTVQNREMAQALGVNTKWVDRITFAFGAGLAGLAGWGVVLTSNPNPEMGQTYIVRSFLTVVVGGVGKLAGVVVSGLSLGFVEKLLEPLKIIETPLRIFDSTWAQVAALFLVVLFMQRKPAGLFPDKGRMADQADKTSAPLIGASGRMTDWVLGSLLVFCGLILVPILYGMGVMSLEFVNKLGYIIAFSICAIGLDLIWGYIGVLSLCQFLFFAVGGYCMGLYLINYGPQDGSEHNIPRALFVVMSDVGGAKRPWFLDLFRSFPVTVFLGLFIPGLLALLIGLSMFRSRVKGVYFSILTQAITVAFWLIFQKNELKLGGTNGLTNFTHILGHAIQADPSAGPFAQTRFWLYMASFICLMLALLVAKLLIHSGFGRVLVAIRDDETRLRFVGYQTWAYKAMAFTIAGVFAAVGGMLYVPQKGIITPAQIAAISSILVVAWVAVGGRGTLWGGVIGAIFVSLVYENMTSFAPKYWYFVLGGLFILVPLCLPGGLMSIPGRISQMMTSRRPATAPSDSAVVVAEGGAH